MNKDKSIEISSILKLACEHLEKAVENGANVYWLVHVPELDFLNKRTTKYALWSVYNENQFHVKTLGYNSFHNEYSVNWPSTSGERNSIDKNITVAAERVLNIAVDIRKKNAIRILSERIINLGRERNSEHAS